MSEEYEDNDFSNGYIIIAGLIFIGSKLLKLFGISINDTLQLVLIVAMVVFFIIGCVKAFIDKMKE